MAPIKHGCAMLSNLAEEERRWRHAATLSTFIRSAMLLALILTRTLVSGALGSPIVAAKATLDPRAIVDSEPNCYDLRDCRTVWDIIWSCVTTFFACTWIAIHPNMPGPYEGRVQLIVRRLGLMVLGLLVPELVIVWALRQWFGARSLARKYEGTVDPSLPKVQ